MNLAKNMIRVGQVNNVYPSDGKIDVLFADKDEVATKIPLLNHEYHMPNVEEPVLCLFLGNGMEQGFCLGSFYSEVTPTPVNDKNIYRKQLDDDTYLEYNKQQKVLKVNVEQVDIQVRNGRVTINADEVLLGTNASEGVPLGNQLKQWLDNHTHDYSWTDAAGNDQTSKPNSPSPSVSEKVKVE
ncbi:phage baseplate assembly protein V [Gracilibacillus sp. YIM 98692]|uniref:phage baseplate assembly protein V n=1 Tax=Gracilibacillus sp. YIM 98692 TaxID=2663532 RepID=UPI0013D7D9B6|nr:phage baseplate assembly protein V [Gracilibacillus sp. YIM 98692]